MNFRKSKGYHETTYVNQFFSVSNKQVAEYAGFIQVSQTDHVLHSVDRGGMHRFDVGGILGGDPVLLKRQDPK